MVRRIRPIWLGIQQSLAEVTQTADESLTGIRVVKAFSREDYEASKFRSVAEYLFTHSYRTNQIQATNGPLLTTLGSLAIVSTIAFGGREVASGQITPGQLVAFMVYLQLLQQDRADDYVIATGETHSVQEFLELFDSEESVERDYLKNILHKLYAKVSSKFVN